MNDKDFKESMDGLPQELDRLYGKGWRTLATLDDLTAADLAKCPDCHKTHRPSYHDQEPCDACCDRMMADSESKRDADETADETSGRSAYNAQGMAAAACASKNSQAASSPSP